MTPSDAAQKVPGPGEVLVGREAELRKLEDWLARTESGEGHVVFLSGESGIGKTTLAAAFLRRARENPRLTICRGRCVDQYGAGEAYLPFLDALGALCQGPGREATLALMKTHAPIWLMQIASAAITPREREELERRAVGATRERMLRELENALSAAASAFPLVILLEDLHWADPSTIDALRFVGKRLARQRIFVLATFRPADLELSNHPLRGCRLDLLTEAHCHELALGPLGPPHLARYLDERFPGHRFPPELAAFVHGRTEGQPLFVVNIVELLLSRGHITLEEGAFSLLHPLAEGDHDVPENLRDMIRRKTEALPEADLSALQAASVIGRDFLSSVLASLMEADEGVLEERLVRLDRVHRLIEARGEEELPDGSVATRYRFVHALYQEVLYEDLTKTRKTALHLRVGHALLRHYGNETARVAAALALHFEQGRDFREAITALLQAGDTAVRRCAYAQALDHFTHALFITDKLPNDEQAARRLRACRRRGQLLYDLGRFDDAARDFALMRRSAIETGDVVLEFAALSGLCNSHFFTQRLEEMAVRAHEALGVAARSGRPPLQAEALVHVAQLVEAEGRLEDALVVLDEIVLESRRIGHEPALLSALAFRGLAHYWQSQYALAEDAFVEAAGLAEGLRNFFLTMACRMHVGLARGNQGRFSEARAVFDEAIDLGRRNGERVWLPRLITQLGWIHRELQDFDRSLPYDEEGLRLARETSAPMAPGTEALLSLSLDYARSGRGDDARRVIEELERIRVGQVGAWFGWIHELRMESVLAELWLLRGDPARTREHSARLREIATRLGALSYLASAHRFLAQVALGEGDVALAADEAAAALEPLGRAVAPLEAWRVYSVLGQVRAAAGEAAAARAAYREAESLVRMLAGGVADQALRETFLASPAVRVVRQGAAGGADRRP